MKEIKEKHRTKERMIERTATDRKEWKRNEGLYEGKEMK